MINKNLRPIFLIYPKAFFFQNSIVLGVSLQLITPSSIQRLIAKPIWS